MLKNIHDSSYKWNEYWIKTSSNYSLKHTFHRFGYVKQLLLLLYTIYTRSNRIESFVLFLEFGAFKANTVATLCCCLFHQHNHHHHYSTTTNETTLLRLLLFRSKASHPIWSCHLMQGSEKPTEMEREWTSVQTKKSVFTR